MLSPLGDAFGQANVIDDRGYAAGLSATAQEGVAEATVWDRDGTPRGLGRFDGGTFSVALGTNGRGDYVGGGNRPGDDNLHAFVSRGAGPLKALPTLTGDPTADSLAHGIDAHGNASSAVRKAWSVAYFIASARRPGAARCAGTHRRSHAAGASS